MKTYRRMKTIKLAGSFLMGLAATAVLAHAHLKTAVPADGAVVNAPPAKVVLTFSEPAKLTACWLQKGAGAKEKVRGLSAAAARQLTIPVPELAAGSYVLSWRVVGDDGHVVPGQIRFTVAPTGK